jgi:3-methyladenine DNA glycosylase AlkD
MPAKPTPRDAVAHFERAFAHGDPARAASQKAYMKSPLRFAGVTMPEVRAAARAYAAAHPALDAPALRALASALFEGVLERRRAVFTDADAPWLIELVRAAGCWAHVDWLATKVLGSVATRSARASKLLRAWAADEDFWVRRTALLAQLDELRAGRGDFALFEALALPMLPEREFFIRKALGWVLRDVSRKRPALVRAFLRAHGAACSPLTRREAGRHLGPAEHDADAGGAPAAARAKRAKRARRAEPG